MKEKIIKNRQLLLIIFAIVLTIVGGTFAWFTWQSTENTGLVVNVGTIAEIVYAEGPDISASNIGPVLDINDGESTSFVVKKRITDALYVFVIVNPTLLPDELKDKSFKIALFSSPDNINYVEVGSEDFSNKTVGNEFQFDVDTMINGVNYYKLIIYIDGNMKNPIEMMDKSFAGTITVDVGLVEPNVPELPDGMIPIKYNGTSWVKADINNINNDWYDYDNKMWANAVMVSSNINYNYYLDDLSSNNYDAELMNGAKVVTVDGEKAIELDGIDDYINVPILPSTINWNNGYTVEVNIKWKTIGSYARIMDFGNGASSNNLIIANWGTSNTPYLSYYNNSTNTFYPYSSISFTANVKEKYKFELTPGTSYYTLKIYLNDILKATNIDKIPLTAFINTARANNYIGKSNWASDVYLDAYIYDFKILDSTGTPIISYDADNVNAIPLNNHERSYYMNAGVGTNILESDILAYYVWIPRYKYRISPSSCEFQTFNSNGVVSDYYCDYLGYDQDEWRDNDKGGSDIYLNKKYIMSFNSSYYNNYVYVYENSDGTIIKRYDYNYYNAITGSWSSNYLAKVEIIVGNNIITYINDNNDILTTYSHSLYGGLMDIKYNNEVVATVEDDYKYNIYNEVYDDEGNGYRFLNETTTSKEIKILFESGNSTTGVLLNNKEAALRRYYTHPSFTFGDEELKGLWVSKFETTGNTIIPTAKPNLIPIQGLNVSNQFTTSNKFGTNTYLTTTGTTQVDAHMIKNTDWGAVTYLQQSRYGLGLIEMGYNNYYNPDTNWNNAFKTGCGIARNEVESEECNSYNTLTGMLASTTGNITGIYDMAGGAWEYVMGVMQDNTGTNIPMSGSNTTSNSGFTGIVYDSGNFIQYTGVSFPAKKYYDLYHCGTSDSDYKRRILGDATAETLGWYHVHAWFVDYNYPWFLRGGYAYGNHNIFDFTGGIGGSNNFSDSGFRSVLCMIP